MIRTPLARSDSRRRFFMNLLIDKSIPSFLIYVTLLTMKRFIQRALLSIAIVALFAVPVVLMKSLNIVTTQVTGAPAFKEVDVLGASDSQAPFINVASTMKSAQQENWSDPFHPTISVVTTMIPTQSSIGEEVLGVQTSAQAQQIQDIPVAFIALIIVSVGILVALVMIVVRIIMKNQSKEGIKTKSGLVIHSQHE